MTGPFLISVFAITAGVVAFGIWVLRRRCQHRMQLEREQLQELLNDFEQKISQISHEIEVLRMSGVGTEAKNGSATQLESAITEIGTRVDFLSQHLSDAEALESAFHKTSVGFPLLKPLIGSAKQR